MGLIVHKFQPQSQLQFLPKVIENNKLKIKSEDGKEHDEDDDKDGDIKEVEGWFLI